MNMNDAQYNQRIVDQVTNIMTLAHLNADHQTYDLLKDILDLKLEGIGRDNVIQARLLR